MVIILMQTLMAVFYGVHFQLYNQLSFYRYILNPLALLFLASDIRDPVHLPRSVAAGLMLVMTLLAYVMSELIF